jgi:hypothetical protein
MNLMNPNADANLAAAITPNPNPLAQQGQPAPATSGSSTMPNAAATKQDPVSANLAYLLLDRQRKAAAAQGLEQGLGEISAGFGTAQQQASKQAALHGGGGAGGGGIGDVSDIMGIQKQVQDQNEYARFHANVGVFAQALRDHGINVTDDQARVLMDSKPFVDSMGTAFGSNVTQTPQVKDYNTAKAELTASMKRDNPTMSDKDIAAAVDARMPPDLLMSSVGGNPEDAAYYQYAARERAAGRTPADPLEYKAQHAQAAKETEDAHKIELQLPGLKSQLNNMNTLADEASSDASKTAIASILGSQSKKMAASAIFNWDGKGPDPAIYYTGGLSAALSGEEAKAVANLRQLHLGNYASNFKDALPGQRLSQQEAMRLGNAADQLGTFSGTVDDYMARVDRVKSRIGHAMSNAHSEARNLDGLPIQYRPKIDPSFLEGPDALKNLPAWAQPKPVNSQADLDGLPYGQAYKAGPAFGKYSGKILFKGMEAGYEDY